MQYIGFIAAFCTTISFIPQVVRTLRTQDTRGISLGMYSIFVFGVSMWLIYGFLLNDLPMIISNIITVILATIILVMKVRDVLK